MLDSLIGHLMWAVNDSIFVPVFCKYNSERVKMQRYVKSLHVQAVQIQVKSCSKLGRSGMKILSRSLCLSRRIA